MITLYIEYKVCSVHTKGADMKVQVLVFNTMHQFFFQVISLQACLCLHWNTGCIARQLFKLPKKKRGVWGWSSEKNQRLNSQNTDLQFEFVLAFGWSCMMVSFLQNHWCRALIRCSLRRNQSWEASGVVFVRSVLWVWFVFSSFWGELHQEGGYNIMHMVCVVTLQLCHQLPAPDEDTAVSPLLPRVLALPHMAAGHRAREGSWCRLKLWQEETK